MAIVLASCKPAKPNLTEVNAESCLKAYLCYYPYSINENFVFVNDVLNRRWEGKAYNRKEGSAYPETYISNNNSQIENEEPSESYGNWISTIHACILEDGVSSAQVEPFVISTYITYTKDAVFGKPISLAWNITLRLSDDEIYYGDMRDYCIEEEMSSMLTDTIIVPMLYQRGNSIISLPEGSYALIIMHKGMTEFSIDGGKTSWKRVKE